MKHKDIKPGNILLVTTGEEGSSSCVCPVYCGFGLSECSSRESKTSGDSRTHFYKAPEQLEGSGRLIGSRAADVFSLGCVLLELAFIISGKKRRRVTRALGPLGFASSPFIKDGVYLQQLPDHNAWWVGMKKLLAGMLHSSVHERLAAVDAACSFAALEEAAGRAGHCHLHVDEVRDYKKWVLASKAPSRATSSAESSDDEPFY